MSRDGSGTYTLPAGYLATTGQTIEATQHNGPFEDLQTDMNTARPVVAGGTGATTATAARDNLEVDGKVLAKSAGYTALLGDRSKTIRCTAALTLDLTAAATLTDGWFIHVIADGGDVTVDPDGSETIDGASTLTINDGSTARIVCDGSTFYTDGARGRAFSGSDASIVTGTAGTNNYTAKWNSDGDLVDGYEVLDEDDMSSDSATKLATQQSIKAYTDNQDLGVGQTWQDVSGSRAVSTSYQNTTGKPIVVSIHVATSSAVREIQVSTDNATWIDVCRTGLAGAYQNGGQVIVPDNHYYRMNGGSIDIWAELR